MIRRLSASLGRVWTLVLAVALAAAPCAVATSVQAQVMPSVAMASHHVALDRMGRSDRGAGAGKGMERGPSSVPARRGAVPGAGKAHDINVGHGQASQCPGHSPQSNDDCSAVCGKWLARAGMAGMVAILTADRAPSPPPMLVGLPTAPLPTLASHTAMEPAPSVSADGDARSVLSRTGRLRI